MDIIREKYLGIEGVRTVAVMADPACRPEWRGNFPPLLEHVWRLHRPDLFLVAGDLAVHATRILRALDPYPAMLAAVPGDHDRPLAEFVRHFGPTRKVVDVGRWRFVGLNTSDRTFRRSEAAFLEQHLRPGTLIFSHVPPRVEGWGFHSLPPVYSDRFLALLRRHRRRIRAAFFGHIHGYSRRESSGVPLFATGGAAESYAVRGNRYDGPGIFQMMIFKPATGRISLCKLPR
jgi:3',5'-cyclic AMP phosphodiesterase CpdA